MPDVAKLKKKAADFELKKQLDKALAVYVEILDGFKDSDEEVDVALYNRVGDLYLKQGNVADAVDYYEQAVDRYAEGGFFNNAIALCNKILRNSPGRASVYYKLGKISARKGFVSDAKVNFLEYADRMQKTGKIDEAFRALKEFADLCPDQDDIRLLLAEQLSKQERGPEAIEQLQLLYERYSQQGRDLEARATIDRMQAIDPTVKPRSSGSISTRAGSDLVFLDLDDSRSHRNSQILKRATHGLDIIHTGEYQEVAPSAAPPRPTTPLPPPELLNTSGLEPALLDGMTRAAEFELAQEEVATGSLLDGLQTVEFETAEMAASPTSGSLLDLEPTDLGAGAPPISRPTPLASPIQEVDSGLLDFTMPSSDASGESGALNDLPMLDDLAEPATHGRPSGQSGRLDPIDDESSIGGELDFILPDDETESSASSDALSDIPLMDLELPTAGEAMQSITDPPVSRPAIDFLDLTDSEVGGDANADVEASIVERTGDTSGMLGPMSTPPAARRSSTMMAEQSVELLQALVDAEPDDHRKRRQLAEAMLDSGDRDGGMEELERAMVGFERGDHLDEAASIADEIVRLNPESVRHHQKRVEYAFRTNERGRLIEAYLALADALFRAGQAEKSRAIYHRVLDLAPDDVRAQGALENFAEEEPQPTPPASAPRVTGTNARIPAAPARPTPAFSPDSEFVNLGDWLRDDELPKDTRMVVEEKEPTGDEEADFQDMLRKFKQGIADNVEEEDHQSHYDLGVAFKEMGLLDEAIAEFQKALRAPKNRVPTYEALGQCFMEKEQLPMAATILGRAEHEKGVSDDQLVGVLYLLGRCAEARGQRERAADYYQRVFVIDIRFRDVGERLLAVESAQS
ncbi:MAG: tetratricopeptide repeat protein [Gemmatimonadaceae bacterium]